MSSGVVHIDWQRRSTVSLVIEGQDLVALVIKRLGTNGPTELARALKLGGMHDVQRVSRWMKSRNGPDYEGTIVLLDALGLLTENGRATLSLPDRPREDEAEVVREARRAADEARSTVDESGHAEPRRGAA